MRPFAVLLQLCLIFRCMNALGQTGDAPKPAPDVIVFNNGDQLTGKFLRGVGGNVIFRSDVAGEITVSLSKIKELRSSRGFAVLKKTDKPSRTPPAVEGNISIADDRVTVETAPGSTPLVLTVKQISYIIDENTFDQEVTRKRAFFAGYTGAVNGGATLVRSTTSANNYTLGVGLVRAIPSVAYLPPRNRTTLNVQETYGKLTTPYRPLAGLVFSEVKTSIFHADAERDEYFTPRFFALAQATFDHNYSQGIQLQQVYGAGVGLTVFKSDAHQLDLKADAHYEKQVYFSATPGVLAAPSQNLIGLTVSDAYRRTLPLKLLFTQSANFMAAFNNSNAYAANGNATLALPVYKRLSIQFSTTDNYLNNPAPGFDKNSYQFTTGVSYTVR